MGKMITQRNEAACPKSHSLFSGGIRIQIQLISVSPDPGNPRNEGREWDQGPFSSEADSFTSFYGKTGDFTLPGLEKRGLMGSFSAKKISEGRGYLKICILSLEIRKCTLTVTRRIKVESKGLSDKGVPGGRGRYLWFH